MRLICVNDTIPIQFNAKTLMRVIDLLYKYVKVQIHLIGKMSKENNDDTDYQEVINYNIEEARS